MFNRLLLADGAYCDISTTWLSEARAEALFQALLAEVPWESREIEVYGRKVPQPRLVAWIGDPRAVYTYSRTRHEPLPWTPTLAMLRAEVAAATDEPFNGVLCNLYRSGADSMGMHRDSEPELGPHPVVASLSLGAARRFCLRHRRVPKGYRVQDDHGRGLGLDLELATGSLLVMRGTTQDFYRHGVPKQPAVRAPRINLTFRRVFPAADT